MVKSTKSKQGDELVSDGWVVGVWAHKLSLTSWLSTRKCQGKKGICDDADGPSREIAKDENRDDMEWAIRGDD